MKVCILGSGLTSLTIAKALVNEGVNVDIFFGKIFKNEDKSRTLSISNNNVEFFSKNIINIKRLLWDVNKIEIYSKNLNNEKVLNFENNNQRLFSIIKNFKLIDLLKKELKKNKLFKIKKFFNADGLVKEKYKLIINCDNNNFITKKFFTKKIKKNYNSYAYTAIIKHKKKNDNKVATQIFTENGPLAFLPISETETSIVYSVAGNKNIDFEKEMRKYNKVYSINKVSRITKFELKSLNLRNYYHDNILAFGDVLHKLHPLAGQGFNMTIRDIKILLKLIKFKLDHGLQIDNSICKDFEKKTKHTNYLFANGIDFIYEFFTFESKTNNSLLSKSVQIFGSNKYMNKILTKIADKGMVI